MCATKLTRCEPDDSVEAAREVSLIREAHGERNADQSLLGTLDHIRCLPNPLLEQVAMRRHADTCLECPGEVKDGQPCVRCQRRDVEILVQMRGDIFLYTPKRTGRQASPQD